MVKLHRIFAKGVPQDNIIIPLFLNFSNKIRSINDKKAVFFQRSPPFTHKKARLGIWYIRKNNRRIPTHMRRKKGYTYILRKTQEVFMNCCSQGNVTLWILIALLVLGTKDGTFCSGIFNGCGLPIVAALLFCLYKNGTLSALLTPPCGCGCCH